ncbi:MAG: diacylglycerol kinase family lipid kinase [Bacteroidetes bacterium]|nr:diacylglycerol kinase family lipid kinase [Bacteroidota bacterium]
MRKRKVVFIINPKSGSDKKTDRVKLIRELVAQQDEFEGEILLWERITDRENIFLRASSGEFDIAVAVGGDGTVSQLAEALCRNTTALGIIPFGSGNGLARHLGIPLDPAAAMKLIVAGHVEKIDRGRFNARSFFCTAGVGFDAHIGKLFAESKTRGFWTYARMTLRELKNYHEENYSIDIDGKKIESKAFLVAIGNGGQYGNDAWITPKAKINDGILEVTLLKPFRWWNAALIAKKLFGKKLDTSSFAETYSGKKIKIVREREGASHYDGEPDSAGKEILVTIDEKVLNMVVPAAFAG